MFGERFEAAVVCGNSPCAQNCDAHGRIRNQTGGLIHSYLPAAFSYAARVNRAALCQLNSFALCNPFALNVARYSESFKTFLSASTRECTSKGSNNRAASPVTSGMLVRLPATTGVPHFMASRIGKPKPSKYEG